MMWWAHKDSNLGPADQEAATLFDNSALAARIIVKPA
jgi:hypothetical protein